MSSASKLWAGPKGSKPSKKQLESLNTAIYQEQAPKDEVKSQERFDDLLSSEIWILIFELVSHNDPLIS